MRAGQSLERRRFDVQGAPGDVCPTHLDLCFFFFFLKSFVPLGRISRLSCKIREERRIKEPKTPRIQFKLKIAQKEKD